MRSFLDFEEARAAAKRFLPRALFDYIDRGTEGETALDAMRHGFDGCRVAPRVLQPVESPTISTRVMGMTRSTPLVVAPTALAGLVRHDGEVGMAQAAAQSGVPYCAATQSSTSIEMIRDRVPEAEIWFQLYVWRDRTETWKLLERVKACKIDVLVLTVDTPDAPKKVHNQRNGFSVPLRPSPRLALDLICHPAWSLGVVGRYWIGRGFPSYANYPGDVATEVTSAIRDPAFALDTVLDWDFLAELRRRWRGKLIVKGVSTPEDACMAFAAGCDAVVVSCHGGRNHDGAKLPLRCLPAIRQAVGPDAALLADSGIRRGSDVAKLLAAGADAVMVGRAPLWGLAANDWAGAARMLSILNDELRAFLRFSGAKDLAALPRLEWTLHTP